ncbi:hypothetical protein B0H21DRAFT_71254 [Amylocystis lapponica]|nr:hypothetical protein B0H21DRAFT_71254 [Amylocystis lapponica]
MRIVRRELTLSQRPNHVFSLSMDAVQLSQLRLLCFDCITRYVSVTQRGHKFEPLRKPASSRRSASCRLSSLSAIAIASSSRNSSNFRSSSVVLTSSIPHSLSATSLHSLRSCPVCWTNSPSAMWIRRCVFAASWKVLCLASRGPFRRPPMHWPITRWRGQQHGNHVPLSALACDGSVFMEPGLDHTIFWGPDCGKVSCGHIDRSTTCIFQSQDGVRDILNGSSLYRPS